MMMFRPCSLINDDHVGLLKTFNNFDQDQVCWPDTFAEYEHIVDMMRTMQGKTLLSINDHPEIRRVFDGFTMIPLQLQYTLSRTKGTEASGELLIKNWNDSQAQLL